MVISLQGVFMEEEILINYNSTYKPNAEKGMKEL